MVASTVGELREVLSFYPKDMPLRGYNGSDQVRPFVSVYPGPDHETIIVEGKETRLAMPPTLTIATD